MALPGSESANLLTQRGIGAARDVASETGDYNAVFAELRERFPGFSGSARSAVARQLVQAAISGSELQHLEAGTVLDPGSIPRNPNILSAYRYYSVITYNDPITGRDMQRKYYLSSEEQIAGNQISDAIIRSTLSQWSAKYEVFRGKQLSTLNVAGVEVLGVERRD